MDYVGIDPAVGLECSSCREISRLPYSELLTMVRAEESVDCSGCGRTMTHDWTTIDVVQNIIKQRMQQANEVKSRRYMQSSNG